MWRFKIIKVGNPSSGSQKDKLWSIALSTYELILARSSKDLLGETSTAFNKRKENDFDKKIYCTKSV